MIANLKSYPTYKDAKLPWLSEVPRHWSIRRAKVVFDKVDKHSTTGDGELLTVSSERGIIPRSGANVTMFKAESYIGYKLCWPGDLVINSLWAWSRGLGVSCHHGIVSSAYGVYRPRPQYSLYAPYFHHFLRSAPFQWELQVRSKGIWISRLQLTDESFFDAPVLLPPDEDQAAIVRFLYHANIRIDKVIHSKKKLIALLEEQRQVIIHRAVTHGLKPQAALKDSGMPHLGRIPFSWDRPLLGRCLINIEQGWSPVAAEGELAPNQWGVLTLSSVRRGVFEPTAIKPVSTSADIPSGIEVCDGDLLLTRSNTRERVGDACVVRGVRPKTILCDLIYRLRLNDQLVIPQFLTYQLLSRVGREQIERDARGSSGTMPKISQSHIRAWRILLPPIHEQHEIVEYIECETVYLDATKRRAEREIELLREYRTCLIADVVTGKLDVRQAAADLPEIIETESTEAFDGNDIELLDDDQMLAEAMP